MQGAGGWEEKPARLKDITPNMICTSPGINLLLMGNIKLTDSLPAFPGE